MLAKTSPATAPERVGVDESKSAKELVMVNEGVQSAGKTSLFGDMKVETRGLLPVPASERRGPLWRISTVWFSANLVPPTFFLGTLATADFIGLGFVEGLFAIIIGNLIGAVVTGLTASMGPRSGMPQLALGRLSFGKLNVLPSALNFFSMIAWAAINASFGATAFMLLTGLPFWVGALAVIVPMAIIVMIGYEAVMQFEKYMAVVLAIVFVIVAVRVIQIGDFGFAGTTTGADTAGSFVLMVTISASFSMSWAVFGSDYTRYLPKNTSAKKTFLYAGGGLFVACTWLEILGLAIATVVVGDSVDTIRDGLLGGGWLGAIAMIGIYLGIISVTTLNSYTGSLSLLTAGLKVPRAISVVIVAVFAFVLLLWLHAQNFDTIFSNYLLLISYWIAPFVAVVITDWYLRRRRIDPDRYQRISHLRSGWQAAVAFVIGLLASVPFMNTDLYVGSITANYLHGADIAYFVGFFVAAVVYLLLWRFAGIGTQLQGEFDAVDAAATHAAEKEANEAIAK